MWKRRQEDWVQSQVDQLAFECELVLSGRYAPLLLAEGGIVPAWAWVGVLAHASEDDLQAWASAVAADEDDELSGTAEWVEAVAFLAREIRAHIRSTSVTLDQLQRTKLVPLELALMRGLGSPMGPGQLVGLVVAAVRHHPSRPQQ